jgi:probable HAF family extracellular repeat protein
MGAVLVLLTLEILAPAGVEAKNPRSAGLELAIVDLGVLRGGTTSRAVDLNEAGHVTGDADTADGATHAFRWGPGPNGPMKDLDTLGGRDSHAVAINATGDIAGNAQTAAGEWRAVFWPVHGRAVDLGTLGGGYSQAADLNDKGEVVGTAERADGTRVAFRWAAGEGMRDLGTLGGPTSTAAAVNVLGQVAGTADRADDLAPHAFVWEASSGMRDIGTVGGRYSTAVDINSSGQVAGTSQYLLDSPEYTAFRWSPGTGIEAFTHAYYTSAASISDNGDVIGNVYGWHHGQGPPVRWTKQGFLRLSAPCASGIYPCGPTASEGNASGFVVGGFPISLGNYRSGSRATRWDAEGRLLPLATLGGESSWGVAINEAGQTVGSAQTADGAVHAVLWR